MYPAQQTYKQKRVAGGFTLTEIVVSVCICTLIGIAFWAAFSDTFSVSRALHNNLVTQQELQVLSRRFSAELRSASPSSAGSYALATTSSSTLSFYADIDSDGLKEQVRYFLDGTTLKKGILKPNGNPPVYSASRETVRSVVADVISTSTPLFSYYDRAYAGTTPPLSAPISPLAVRFIKIFLVIDADENNSPEPLIMTTGVSIRSVKDNL